MTAPVTIADMTRIAVGWSHETWLFDACWTDADGDQRRGLCLRRDPGNALLRETQTLASSSRCCSASRRPTSRHPRPTGTNPIRPCSARRPSSWTRCRASAPARGAKRPRVLRGRGRAGRAAGELHRRLGADPQRRLAGGRADFLGVPSAGTDFASREIAKWRELIDDSGHPGHPILADLIGWLEANAPIDRSSHPGPRRLPNRQRAHRRRPGLGGLDWELQVIGDPMYDVAYMLTELNREGTDLLSNVVPRELFFERYQAATGIEIDEDVSLLPAALRHAIGRVLDERSRALRRWPQHRSALARTEWSVTVALERAAQELGY